MMSTIYTLICSFLLIAPALISAHPEWNKDKWEKKFLEDVSIQDIETFINNLSLSRDHKNKPVSDNYGSHAFIVWDHEIQKSDPLPVKLIQIVEYLVEDFDHDDNHELLALGNFNGRGGNDHLLYIRRLGNAYLIQDFRVSNIASIEDAITDLDTDKIKEIVIDVPVGSYRGATFAFSYFRTIYRLHNDHFVDASGSFPDLYEKWIDEIRSISELQKMRYKPTTDEIILRSNTEEQSANKTTELLLSLHINRGEEEAKHAIEQWINSEYPALRENAQILIKHMPYKIIFEE
jgi:hypothetical protein